MAKIHKVTAYIVDPNEEYDKDKIEGVLDNYLNATSSSQSKGYTIIEQYNAPDSRFDDSSCCSYQCCHPNKHVRHMQGSNLRRLMTRNIRRFQRCIATHSMNQKEEV